jgi:two-component system, NarL family, nitrate/nitrite response regulator NarL
VTASATHTELQVAIVDDHLLFAQALELALTREGYAATLVEISESQQTTPVLRTVLDIHPDVVLLDLDLGPAGDGFPLIEPAVKAGIEVVVLTASEEPGQWARAVMTGAKKVLPKTVPLREVVSTVTRVAAGEEVMENGERQELLDAWVAKRSGNEALWERLDQLTLRESEVLGLLMQGRSVRDIARIGDTSEGTVRTQVKAVLSKLGVSSQIAAVGLAYQVEWRSPTTLRAPSAWDEPDLG